MKLFAVLAVVFSLIASPVLAGMIQVQEADEAATCELRSAGMVTTWPENGVIFPREDNCAAAEADTRDDAAQEGALEVAGYSPADNR